MPPINLDLLSVRENPYKNINNEWLKPAKELIVELGKRIEQEEVTDQEFVQFFQDHKLMFLNSETQRLSNTWQEESDAYKKASFICTVSCSCECGPLSEPCYQRGLEYKFST